MWEGLFRVGAGGQRTPLSDRLPLKLGGTGRLELRLDLGDGVILHLSRG